MISGEINNFKGLIDFFDRMINEEANKHRIPVQIGVCNCCLLKEKGHYVQYRYPDGEIVRLFICLVCMTKCPPQGFCQLEGTSLKITYDKYVTHKNKK